MSVPERETSPTLPSRKTSAGMIPTFALPGESTPGQFGPISVTPRARRYAREAEHVVRRDVLGDADDGRDARVGRLVDGVGGEARRDEDERSRSRRCASTAAATVSKTGMPSTSWPPLPGRDAGDDVRPVGAVAQAEEAALAAGQALDDEPRLAVDEDRH